MFDKKKLNFWRLAAIFLGYTGITLLALWLSPQMTKASMMNESMANTAKMHLNRAAIYNILNNNSDDNRESQPTVSSQHHEGMAAVIKTLGMVTTLIIFTLLPLLIFGTVILAIVWIK